MSIVRPLSPHVCCIMMIQIGLYCINRLRIIYSCMYCEYFFDRNKGYIYNLSMNTQAAMVNKNPTPAIIPHSSLEPHILMVRSSLYLFYILYLMASPCLDLHPGFHGDRGGHVKCWET